MPDRLASLPVVQEQIDRIQRIFPKGTGTWSDDGQTYVHIYEDNGLVYILRVTYDFPTMTASTAGTAIRSRNWKPVALDECLELISEKA